MLKYIFRPMTTDNAWQQLGRTFIKGTKKQKEVATEFLEKSPTIPRKYMNCHSLY
jgi:hypothetical protein